MQGENYSGWSGMKKGSGMKRRNEMESKKEEEGKEADEEGRREQRRAGRPNNGAAHLMVNLNGG